MYRRTIQLSKNKSFFLFGARQTGKSTLLDHHLKTSSLLKLDLLEHETFLRYKTDPALFRAECEKFIQQKNSPVIFVDEVQKVPEILDGVHWLMHRYPQTQFILTGSSARKLKRGGANMLAGRALEYHLYPLTYIELGTHFDLDVQLGKGSLPPIVDATVSDAQRTLQAYASVYLKEEILDEALVRNIQPFNRFLEIAADQNGELVNYSNIARDVGIASKTIQDYYQILEDTLLINRVLPYLKGARKRLIQQSKYYFFDLGVTNILCKRPVTPAQPRTALYGRQFEHFIFLEMKRLAHYFEMPLEIFHWRDSNRNEVDFILENSGQLIACEVKSKDQIQASDIKGLISFSESHPDARLICLSLSPRAYQLGAVEIWPWREFFETDLFKQK